MTLKQAAYKVVQGTSEMVHDRRQPGCDCRRGRWHGVLYANHTAAASRIEGTPGANRELTGPKVELDARKLSLLPSEADLLPDVGQIDWPRPTIAHFNPTTLGRDPGRRMSRFCHPDSRRDGPPSVGTSSTPRAWALLLLCRAPVATCPPSRSHVVAPAERPRRRAPVRPRRRSSTPAHARFRRTDRRTSSGTRCPPARPERSEASGRHRQPFGDCISGEQADVSLRIRVDQVLSCRLPPAPTRARAQSGLPTVACWGGVIRGRRAVLLAGTCPAGTVATGGPGSRPPRKPTCAQAHRDGPQQARRLPSTR